MTALLVVSVTGCGGEEGSAEGGACGSATGGSANAGGTGGEFGTVGQPCSQEGDTKGSCSTSSLEICRNFVWTPGECRGCSILSGAGATCRYAEAYVEATTGERIPGASVSFTQGEGVMNVDINSEVSLGYVGVIKIELDSPVAVSSAVVSLSSTSSDNEIVLADGASNCVYEAFDGAQSIGPGGTCSPSTYSPEAGVQQLLFRVIWDSQSFSHSLALTEVTLSN